jgi:predicted small lipoprotein YifL
MKATRLPLTVLLVATAALAGCGESTPLENSAPPPAANLLGWPPASGVLGALLKCSPLPSATTTETIGPEGGTLQVGPHSLTVPPGALQEPVTITAIAPSDTVNTVQFQPEGLQFSRPASLTMSYANCGLLGPGFPRRIAFTDDALAILYYLPSVDRFLSQAVTARLGHFSHYAIAW